MTRLQRDRDAAVEGWIAETQAHHRPERRDALQSRAERETNASSRFAAPEASERRKTKELCPMDTAESTGARETTVPEERSAAVRRDGTADRCGGAAALTHERG